MTRAASGHTSLFRRDPLWAWTQKREKKRPTYLLGSHHKYRHLLPQLCLKTCQHHIYYNHLLRLLQRGQTTILRCRICKLFVLFGPCICQPDTSCIHHQALYICMPPVAVVLAARVSRTNTWAYYTRVCVTLASYKPSMWFLRAPGTELVTTAAQLAMDPTHFFRLSAYA